MLTVLSANGPSGYNIANSLRFRSSASAYLSRTPSVAGNRQTWTWSGWIKRGALGAAQILFGAASSPNGSYFRFESSDALRFYDYNGTTFSPDLITTQVFRDPSAWYHVVLVSDTTNATAANRVRLYVNGTQVTAFSTATYPAQNANNTSINNTYPTTIGAASATIDGYFTEINFIDGQALTPSSFGEIDSTTGVWKAKRYTGTYGTNGFRLNFSNGTSTTTLGYDSSGNGNNWTTNNISLTAGSTYDWMIDSPTKFPGSSYGVGNYCVWNPIDLLGASPSTDSANLNFGGSAGKANKGTFWVSAGKWYFEYTVTSIGNSGAIGIATPAYVTTSSGYYAYRNSGVYYPANTAYGNSYTTNDVIGIAFDMDSGKVWASKNGTWQNSGDPVAGTNAMATGISGLVTPLVETYGSGGLTGAANFGQRPFAYTPPSGYKSLCTQNLPVVTIQNGAQYMAATTYTGNGTSQSIVNTVNGVSFQPNFVWVKSRSLVAGHELVDSVRGAAKTLYSNLTNAEDTTSQTVTAFNSNGFSVGADTGANSNGATQIAWQWKAGGTAVTNTAGSITSSVSANTTSGFSVVTYTGNGTASTQTIGHGLGTTLSMLILKGRASSGDMNWGVSHTSIAAPNYLLLNSTGQADNYGPGQGQPSIGTGNTFKVLLGTTGTTNYNTNGATYVAYCFAAIPGYSAFGSYTGNGSADGPFVYCGFRPRFVMIKRTDSTGYDWPMRDAARSPYNEVKNTLLANSSNAEATNNLQTDFLSNGFKLRDTGGNGNASGGTYIYAAFAENPFQNALAR